MPIDKLLALAPLRTFRSLTDDERAVYVPTLSPLALFGLVGK